jgi:hypothetical protein
MHGGIETSPNMIPQEPIAARCFGFLKQGEPSRR